MLAKQKFDSAKCNRYKVECNICKEKFDNDYAKKHTAIKHPDLAKQNRLAPITLPGELKRKNPWFTALPLKRRETESDVPTALEADSDGRR